MAPTSLRSTAMYNALHERVMGGGVVEVIEVVRRRCALPAKRHFVVHL